jgi:cystatin-A/B
MSACGGTSEAKAANEEIQLLCNQMRKKVEEQANRKFDEFTAISYTTQVVAGTNFFVKVHVGNDECAHVRIFRPLPHVNEMPSMHGYQLSKTRDEAIAYF